MENLFPSVITRLIKAYAHEIEGKIVKGLNLGHEGYLAFQSKRIFTGYWALEGFQIDEHDQRGKLLATHKHSGCKFSVTDQNYLVYLGMRMVIFRKLNTIVSLMYEDDNFEPERHVELKFDPDDICLSADGVIIYETYGKSLAFISQEDFSIKYVALDFPISKVFSNREYVFIVSSYIELTIIRKYLKQDLLYGRTNYLCETKTNTYCLSMITHGDSLIIVPEHKEQLIFLSIDDLSTKRTVDFPHYGTCELFSCQENIYVTLDQGKNVYLLE